MTTTSTRPPTRRPDRPAAAGPALAMTVNGKPWEATRAASKPAARPAPSRGILAHLARSGITLN